VPIFFLFPDGSDCSWLKGSAVSEPRSSLVQNSCETLILFS